MLLFNWFSCNLQGAQTILTPNFLLPLCFISPWPFPNLVATQISWQLSKPSLTYLMPLHAA